MKVKFMMQITCLTWWTELGRSHFRDPISFRISELPYGTVSIVLVHNEVYTHGARSIYIIHILVERGRCRILVLPRRPPSSFLFHINYSSVSPCRPPACDVAILLLLSTVSGYSNYWVRFKIGTAIIMMFFIKSLGPPSTPVWSRMGLTLIIIMRGKDHGRSRSWIMLKIRIQSIMYVAAAALSTLNNGAVAQVAGSHTDIPRWCGKPYESGWVS